MQCSSCKNIIDNPKEGFAVCPHCGKVNLTPSKPSQGVVIGDFLVMPQSAKRSKFQERSRAIVFTVALLIVGITGGLLTYTSKNTPHSNQVPSQSVKDVKKWQKEDDLLANAEQLVTQNKFDEAISVLARIPHYYPQYSKVTELQKTIEAKKAEIAKAQKVDIPQQAPPAVVVPKQASTPTQATPFTTSIAIKGDASCQSTTLAALRLLSEKAPKHYANVTTYISVIECISQGSGMYAYENPPRYVVGDATRNAGTIWYSGTIAHDAGHSKLYHDYISTHPGASVPNDVWTGQSAEHACLDAQYDALSNIGATQSQLDYVKNIINSQYWNIPYDQRWW